MKLWILFLLGTVTLFSFSNTDLVVFYNGKDKRETAYFESDSVKEAWTTAFGDYKFIDIRETGAPENINFTPQIVANTSLGKSFYVGKYSNIGRIKNFYRTARVVKQSDEIDKLKDVLVHTNGNADLVLKFKMTKVGGDTALNFVKPNWKKSIKRLIAKESKVFSFAEFQDFQSKLDRKIYVDIHPYIGDNKLYLSYQIFSQYNCIDPILDNSGAPFQIAYNGNADQAYIDLFKEIEKKIYLFLKNDASGYGYAPKSERAETIKWNKIFEEKKGSKKNIQTTQELNIYKEWEIAGQVDSLLPLVSFHFLKPVDNYAGEVKILEGGIEFKSDRFVFGKIEVPLASVTMGDDFLDSEVHGSKLEIGKFPKAYVKIDSMYLANKLEWGVRSSFEWSFELILKEYRQIVPFKGFIEPVLDEEGKVNLIMNAGFTLNSLYENYHIKGPDGPKESANTMRFYINVKLK